MEDARVARRGVAGVEDRQLRLLGLALAASLVLHALVLFLLPVLKEAQRRLPAPPLTAHLEAPRPAQPAPVPPKFEPTPVPAPMHPAPVTKAAPRAPASPPILSIERAPQAAEPAFVVPAQVPTPAQLGSDQAANTAAQSGPQAASAARGPDAGAIGKYRIELMEMARRYKRYPRIAQDNNWEGRVELRVVIGQDGAISSFTVKKGAGRAVLDEQAQELIRTAQSKLAIPAALRGTAFPLEITVDYYLKDEEK